MAPTAVTLLARLLSPSMEFSIPANETGAPSAYAQFAHPVSSQIKCNQRLHRASSRIAQVLLRTVRLSTDLCFLKEGTWLLLRFIVAISGELLGFSTSEVTELA